MKILHVAVFTPKSTNVWQANAFENLGHEVIRYDYRAKARKLDGSLTNSNPKRDNDIISLCRKEKPDIILFSKCNWMDVRVVKECGEIGTTVLWMMDDIHMMDAEFFAKAKNSDCIFTSCITYIDKLKKYCRNVYKLHGGYNPDVHYPMNVSKKRDVCFIGSMHTNRKKFAKEVNFEIISGVYNKKHSRIVSETKINLNFTEGRGTSNRLYKLLAAKGFVLTQPWDGMKEDFVVTVDLDIFRTPEELREKINYYLSHEDEREKIAEHGYKTVQNYDATNYAHQIIKKVEEIKNEFKSL